MASDNQRESSFGRFLLGLAIIGLIALVFSISPKFVERIYSAERDSVRYVLGEEGEVVVYQEAYSEPSQELKESASTMEREMGKESGIARWVHGRIEATWWWGNLISYRMTMLLTWMLCLIPLVFGIFADGYYIREKKKNSFSSQSPLSHKAGLKLVVLMLFLLIGSLFVPLNLPSLFVIPTLLVGLGAGGWLWVSNLQKRL